MVNIEEAVTELLRRRQARQHLLDFTTYTYPQYKPEPFHQLVAAKLDEVIHGSRKKVIIVAPPQHGKSELVTVRLPALWLANRPEDPVILCSYGEDLSHFHSRQARQCVESEEFKMLFPSLSTDASSRAVDAWNLDGHRGGLKATGVSGGITGHGALLGIVDDPIRSWEDAQSELIRETAWNWIAPGSTFRSRLWEGGSVVIITTRWHEDDPVGRLLAEEAEDWEVLRFPALAESQEERDENNKILGLPTGQPDPLGREKDEALAPGRYSAETLKEIRARSTVTNWNCIYQGVPTTAAGNIFKREHFQIVGGVPTGSIRVRYWDLARSHNTGDYTSGVLMAMGTDGYFYTEDVVRGRWEVGERNRILKETAARDADLYHNTVLTWIEQAPAKAGKEEAMTVIRELAGYTVFADPASGDKEVRANPLASIAQANLLRIVRGTWNNQYIQELCSFPNAKHDDQVDSSSGAFNRLALAMKPQRVKHAVFGES